MIKSSLLIINFLGLFFTGIFTADEILIENNIPTVLVPGQKKEVQVVINKGEVQGFSKMELSLPMGLTASPGDTKGGSFTFSGQKAKFVWMTLPTDASFTVTYFIESAENLEGNYTIDGSFSYVKENKREDIAIPSKSVNVKKQLSPTPEEVAQTMPGVKVEAEVVDMVCERIITKISDTEYEVGLTVRNNIIKGTLARILETVPEMCTTEADNAGGATVTQQGNTIKFVWFEAPDANEFTCSYRISCTETTLPAITGVFSYVLEGDPYDLPVIGKGELPSEPVVHAPVTSIPVPVKPDDVNTADNNTGSENEGQNDTSDTADNTDDSPVTSIPSPETGITYKVQILAAHRIVNKSFMKKTYNFKESFNIENHEGWVKYTTGKFSEYGKARDARERMKSDYTTLPGPFVTAYNDGERVTVQEALLISQQSWVQ